jgi:hypothetical protein
MTIQMLRAQTATEFDLELPVVLCVSLAGLTLSLALLPLLGPGFAMVLALAA